LQDGKGRFIVNFQSRGKRKTRREGKEIPRGMKEAVSKAYELVITEKEREIYHPFFGYGAPGVQPLRVGIEIRPHHLFSGKKKKRFSSRILRPFMWGREGKRRSG